MCTKGRFESGRDRLCGCPGCKFEDVTVAKSFGAAEKRAIDAGRRGRFAVDRAGLGVGCARLGSWGRRCNQDASFDHKTQVEVSFEVES